MQIGFCYAPHAWLNYCRIIIFDFTFFEKVGIFLILYNFPIKISRRYKNLILPLVVFLQQYPILCSLLKILCIFPYSFLSWCHYRKGGKHAFPVFFSVSFSVTLYIRQSAYIVADCKRHRKKHKIGNDFSGFSKRSDLISEHVKRKTF